MKMIYKNIYCTILPKNYVNISVRLFKKYIIQPKRICKKEKD